MRRVKDWKAAKVRIQNLVEDQELEDRFANSYLNVPSDSDV